MARFPARRMVERTDLSVPRGATPRMGARYDADAFGRFSEAIARFLGTGRFLVGQTVLVIGWIALNTFGLVNHWDPYPFILLNLAFSTQAAYAAPLILLAQNRQDDRDRANIERDREVAARTQADTEFLARELAAVRLALADVVTTEDLEDSLGRMAKLITDQLRDTPGTLTSSDGHLPRHGDQGRPGDGPLPPTGTRPGVSVSSPYAARRPDRLGELAETRKEGRAPHAPNLHRTRHAAQSPIQGRSGSRRWVMVMAGAGGRLRVRGQDRVHLCFEIQVVTISFGLACGSRAG